MSRDILQLASWVIGSIGLLTLAVAALLSVRELAEARRLRAAEFRWRKSQVAKEIVERTTGDRLCREALSMLERSGGKYEVAFGHPQEVTWDDLAMALAARTTENGLPEKFAYIQECVGALCDALEMCEHYVRTGLVTFSDVEFPMAFCVSALRKHWPAVSSFMHSHKYKLAVAFVDRFPHEQ